MTSWFAASFEDITSQAVVSLTELSIKATAILVVAGAIAMLLRQEAAAMKHLVWMSAFMLVFVLPLSSVILPQWRVLPSWPGLAKFENAPVTSDVDVNGSEAGSTAHSDALSSLDSSNVAHSAAPRTNGFEIESETARYVGQIETMHGRGTHSEVSWPMHVVLITWLIGLSISLLRVFAAFVSLNRIRQASDLINQGKIFDQFRHLGRELNIRGKVQLLCGDEHVMPMAWGVRRSFVLVPNTICDWPASQRRAMLLHELGHIARRDPAWQLIVELVRALYWFNPLVWFAIRRLQFERECACDDLVLHCGVPPQDYARQLLEVVSHCRPRRVGYAVGVAMAAASRIERRLRSIMDDAAGRFSLSRWHLAISCAICVIFGLPLSMLRSADPPKNAADVADKSQDSASSGAPAESKRAEESNPDEVEEQRLAYLDSVKRDDLDAVTSVVVSSDGRFLYASAYQAASHVVFSRDQKTGKLTHIQTVQNVERLAGATALRLSRDERFAVAAAWRSKAISLYSRDKESGKLVFSDSKQQDVDEGISGLDFTVEAQFSPDGRFVYALDDRGSVTSFRLTGMKDSPKLEFVEAFRNEDLLGARGMVHHPSGKYLFVTCKTANTLVAIHRGSKSGKLTIADVVRDEADGVTGLHSVFGVNIAKDGKFVYTVSGQHGGGKDNSVGVFRFDDEKEKLSRVQEVLPAEIELDGKRKPFNGGNEITLDPAQGKVYACATASGSLAVFDRDLKTGKVAFVQLFHDGELLGWVSGLAVSPDSRFVYAASERVDSIAIFGPPSLATKTKQPPIPDEVESGLQFDAAERRLHQLQNPRETPEFKPPVIRRSP